MNEGNAAAVKIPHSVVLEDRRRLTVSGISDVDSFDEQTIVVFTPLGELTVKGADLHISHLDLEMGELAVKILIDWLNGEEVPQSSILPVSFIRRDSSDPKRRG